MPSKYRLSGSDKKFLRRRYPHPSVSFFFGHEKIFLEFYARASLYYMRVSFSVCSLLFGRKKFAKGLAGNEKGVLL